MAWNHQSRSIHAFNGVLQSCQELFDAQGRSPKQVSSYHLFVSDWLELELELIQTHMAQKPMLRVEVAFVPYGFVLVRVRVRVRAAHCMRHGMRGRAGPDPTRARSSKSNTVYPGRYEGVGVLVYQIGATGPGAGRRH